MNRMFKILLAILLSSSSFAVAQPLRLWGSLEQGSYGVGFRTVFLYDQSRTFKTKYDESERKKEATSARPIQIALWYPAKKSERAPKMLFAEYAYLVAREERFGELTAAAKERGRTLLHKSLNRWLKEEVPDNKLAELLDMRTACIKDAAPAKGRFPTMIVAQGASQSCFTHSIVCEYLASHGYVVVTSPSMGTYTREITIDSRGTETQARDVEFIISYLHNISMADEEKLALAGFSFGGSPLMIVPMRNTNIDALVSLDSFVGFQGVLPHLQQSPSFDIGRMKVPLLHVVQHTNPFLDSSLIDTLRYADRYIVRIKGLNHFDFSSLGMMSAIIPGFVQNTRPNQRAGYEALAYYVLNFLDAVLKGDAAGKKFLMNGVEANGFSPDLLETSLKKGIKAPPTVEEFADIIVTRGIAHAREVFVAEKQNAPDNTLFKEAIVNRLGYEFLYARDMVDAAIEIFRWNVEAYPASSNVYDSLGEAYLRKENRELAIKNYQKSLKLNPDNTNAVDVLKSLNAK